MKPAVLALLASALLPAAAGDIPVPADLLRFTNGNQLDGRFGGLKEGPTVLWKREDLTAPIEFRTDQLRQVVLRGGVPAKGLPDLSGVTLVNGDRIPGRITALTAEQVTVETAFAGTITLPRKQVAMIAPNPLGGRALYSGPFSDEGWKLLPLPDDPRAANLPAAPQKEPKAAEDPPGWSYSGSSWYSRQTSAALNRDVGMPDRAVVRFHVAWKSRLSLSFAFHADFKEPPAPKNNEQKPNRFEFAGAQALPRAFGNSYVITLYPSYVILYRCGYGEDGEPVAERIQTGANNVKLSDTGEASVELRCNRKTGDIALYLNDEFAVQWSEPPAAEGPDGYAGKGGGIGFLVQPPGTPIRVSDIIVSEWNGMPDPARSLQTDDQDIVLLANGTDRFAGEVEGFEDGKLHVKGRYGDYRFPLDEIAEVRFARKRLAKAEAAETAGKNIDVRFHPLGRISGVPEASDPSRLTLATPDAGRVTVDLDYAVTLDLKRSNSFLDDWDTQF